MEIFADIKFTDNTAIKARQDYYMEIFVKVPDILKNWQSSLFSFEWVLSDGRIKTLEELSESEKIKRVEVEQKIRQGLALEKPILGIGLMENVEIGSGRAIFLTLAAHGLDKIPVHIPKSNQSDFKEFLADICSSA